MSAGRITYPSRDAWIAARSEGIGASEAAAILGISPWQSPYALWAQKLGIVDPPVESDAMRWGLKLEPLIAEQYTESTGREVYAEAPYTVHISDAAPWLRCTLDRSIVAIDTRGDGVLELKATHSAHAADWEEEAPLHYQVQVQHQLAVTGRQWGSLAVLIGGQTFRWVDVARNDAFIEQLLKAEAAFWQRLIDRDPPPVDGSEATAKALAALYPRESRPDPIVLPPEAEMWDAQRQAATEAMEKAKAAKDEADAHLKALIGEAPAGVLPGGITYTWKTQQRAGYTVAPSEVRVLRRLMPRRRAA